MVRPIFFTSADGFSAPAVAVVSATSWMLLSLLVVSCVFPGQSADYITDDKGMPLVVETIRVIDEDEKKEMDKKRLVYEHVFLFSGTRESTCSSSIPMDSRPFAGLSKKRQNKAQNTILS